MKGLISLAAPYIDGSNLFQLDSDGSPSTFSFRDYALLQRKVEKLQNIITILKSADYLVSAPTQGTPIRSGIVFTGKYEVHIICEVLDVDRSTFYNHMLLQQA